MAPYVKFTAQEIIDCLLETMKEPEDAFELAMYYDSFVRASKKITENFRDCYNKTVQNILSEGLTSDVYEVVERFNENKVVDKVKLKAELPDIYYNTVHIRGSDAAKLLTREELYNAVVNKIGAERAEKYEQVNADDMKKYLPTAEYAEYLKEDGRSLGLFVGVKESARLV